MKKEYLKHIKSSGFNTPNDYFDAFDDKLLKKISTEETIINTKSTGFKTPKGYFDTVDTSIINTLSETKETKVISLFNRKTIVYISGIAAAALIFFNISIFNTNMSIEDIELATVENYILEDDISSYEIASLLTEEELNENDIIDYGFQDENIEEYLLNNADIEALILEQ